MFASVVVLSDSAYMNAMGNVYQRTSKYFVRVRIGPNFFALHHPAAPFAMAKRSPSADSEERAPKVQNIDPGVAQLYHYLKLRYAPSGPAARSSSPWERRALRQQPARKPMGPGEELLLT